MKLLFTSDLHGREAAYVRFSDLLRTGGYDADVIAGDLMTYPSEAAIDRATEVYRHARARGKPPRGDERSFVERTAVKDDELTLKAILKRSRRRAAYRGRPFVGYQYTNPYVGGSFERTEREQEADFLALERLIDRNTVLITHGPPEGVLDLTRDGKHVGSRALRRLVDRRPPRLHLFGHIHQMFGVEGRSVNGSYPHGQKFVAIDTETLETTFVE